MNLSEQLAAVKTVEDMKKHLFNERGELRYELAPPVRPEDAPLILEVLKGLGQVTNPTPTTSPVTAIPTPVGPVAPVELLPGLSAGFKLKGFEKKQEVVDFIKGRTYEGEITVERVDGGGVYGQGLYPNNKGFGYTDKLKVGVNPINFVSPVNGPHPYSVEANNANASITKVSLTLKAA